MNVRTTKLPPERLESVDIDRFGIIAYGDNNLYPQHLKRIDANLMDKIAAEYLAKYPNMAKYFATIPEKPVFKPADALKADKVVNYPRKQRKPRKTKKHG